VPPSAVWPAGGTARRRRGPPAARPAGCRRRRPAGGSRLLAVRTEASLRRSPTRWNGSRGQVQPETDPRRCFRPPKVDGFRPRNRPDLKTRQSNFQTYLMLQCSVKCVMLYVTQYCIDRPVSNLLSLGWSGTSGLKQNRGLQSLGCPIARSPNSGERAIGRPVADAPKLWPKDTSRTTELVLQCWLHQKKSTPRTNSQTFTWSQKKRPD
jgi:hypothetical protein